ncbi:MAG: hypothetical protein LBF80_02525 [Spirochaetaceae bacterium]|jgi:hypothetical protein|nr:hypothetical protein [Spirochaetaceae bacterium]
MEVVEGYGLHIQTTFLTGGSIGAALKVFDIKRPDIAAKAKERKAGALETKIKAKEEVIAERA